MGRLNKEKWLLKWVMCDSEVMMKKGENKILVLNIIFENQQKWRADPTCSVTQVKEVHCYRRRVVSTHFNNLQIPKRRSPCSQNVIC